MNHSISIEKVEIGNVIQLREIGRQTFYETFVETNTTNDMQDYLNKNFSLEKLKAEISTPDSEFYFAKQYEQIIGYLKINTGKAQTEFINDNCLEIERIYVYKSYMGKKVGQILCDKAIQIAHNKQVEYIWLGVWENNTRAVRFYEKNGFSPFSTHVFTLGTDKQTDILMKRAL